MDRLAKALRKSAALFFCSGLAGWSAFFYGWPAPEPEVVLGLAALSFLCYVAGVATRSLGWAEEMFLLTGAGMHLSWGLAVLSGQHWTYEGMISGESVARLVLFLSGTLSAYGVVMALRRKAVRKKKLAGARTNLLRFRGKRRKGTKKGLVYLCLGEQVEKQE